MTPSELRSTLQVLVDGWGKGEAVRTLLLLVAVAERQPVTQMVLMRSLGVDNYTTGTTMVRRLIAAGLISSDIDPEHRSYRRLTLTAAGEVLLRKAGVAV